MLRTVFCSRMPEIKKRARTITGAEAEYSIHLCQTGAYAVSMRWETGLGHTNAAHLHGHSALSKFFQ